MQKRSYTLNSIVKYTVCAIVVLVPLFPKFPLIKVPGTFVAIRLEDLLLFISAVLLGIILLPDLTHFAKVKLNQTVFLYLFVGFISFLSAALVTKTVVPHIGFLHLLRRIEYFIPLFLGMVVIGRSRPSLEFYLKILLIVVIIAFIYGFGQKHFDWPIVITQNEEYSKGVALRYVAGSHVNSTFAGHYDLATFLVLVLPIFITSFFVLKGFWTRLLLFFGYFSGMWLLVNAASRISLVSYLVAATLSLFFVRKIRVIPLVLIVSIGFTGFSSNLLDRYLRIFEVTKERLQVPNATNYNFLNLVVFAADEDNFPQRRLITPTPTPVPVFEDRSTNIRLNSEWPRALRAFSKNPLLGTGYSSITLATDNDYLRLLGETGLLGFLAFFLIFMSIAQTFLKAFPFNKNLVGLELGFISAISGALPGIFVNALFIDVFEASKFATIFWLLIGMTFSLAKNE